MNWHNRHLSDILDLFRTFIGHKRESEEGAKVNEKSNEKGNHPKNSGREHVNVERIFAKPFG